MPDLPEAAVCHFTSNRLRLRIPERRRDAVFFETVKRRLSEWSSIERIAVNPVTASILLHFSDLDDLLVENAARNDLFTVAVPEPDALADLDPADGRPLIEQVRHGLEEVDHGLRRLSGGQAGLRALVLFGLLGTGVVQLLRGNMTAPAVTLFWYAGDMLRLWRDDGAPEPGTGEQV